MTPNRILELWGQVAPSPPAARIITFHNTGDHFVGTVATTWWRKNDVERRTKAVQREMLVRRQPTVRHRLSATELYERTVTKADQETARAYATAGTIQMRIAVLLLAGLIGRYNRHVARPTSWPEENEILSLRSMLIEMAGHAAPQWKLRAVSGIPVPHDDDDLAIDDNEALILHIAAECGTFMEDHVPVIIVNSAEATPLALSLRREMDERASERTETTGDQQEKLSTLRDLDEVAWRGMTRRELMTAAWNEPVSILADRCKVSSSLLTRTLRNLGIPTPPQGFWAQVHAGKRPHPKGVPDLAPTSAYEHRERRGEKRYARRREEDRSHGRNTSMQRPMRAAGRKDT